MQEDGRSRWELEKCGWGDEAIELLFLKDHIAESGRIYDRQCKRYFRPFAFCIDDSIYTIIAGVARRLFSGTRWVATAVNSTSQDQKEPPVCGCSFLDVGYLGYYVARCSDTMSLVWCQRSQTRLSVSNSGWGQPPSDL